MHHARRGKKVNGRRDEQIKKGPETDSSIGTFHPLLPNHQGGNITERAENPSGIGWEPWLWSGQYDSEN